MITNEEYMELKVLRKHRLSLRDISAQTGMAVNTVRKYLAGGPPVMKKLQARRSKLDPFKDYLAGRIQAAKPDWIPATVLLREIAEQGYQGSIRILQEYLQELRPQARPDPVVRFETQPGEQMQMDWIEFRKAGHKDGMLAAFVATLGHSRASFVEFVTDMKLETLLACHVRAFESFGGVTREVLYDNMKTVILKRDAYGKTRTSSRVPLLTLPTTMALCHGCASPADIAAAANIAKNGTEFNMLQHLLKIADKGAKAGGAVGQASIAQQTLQLQQTLPRTGPSSTCCSTS